MIDDEMHDDFDTKEEEVDEINLLDDEDESDDEEDTDEMDGFHEEESY